jgi:hypothetical protein
MNSPKGDKKSHQDQIHESFKIKRICSSKSDETNKVVTC